MGSNRVLVVSDGLRRNPESNQEKQIIDGKQ